MITNLDFNSDSELKAFMYIITCQSYTVENVNLKNVRMMLSFIQSVDVEIVALKSNWEAGFPKGLASVECRRLSKYSASGGNELPIFMCLHFNLELAFPRRGCSPPQPHYFTCQTYCCKHLQVPEEK